MNETEMTVHKAVLLEALARLDGSIRIASITVLPDRIILTGKQGDRYVWYAYERKDQCWVEK